MPSHSQLHDLESQLLWCREWYVLRLWQQCGSEESANEFDRFQIAQELLDDSYGRTKEWALIGRSKLIDHLLLKLDDPDLEVRQEAVIGLGDHCPKDHPAVEILIERLRSSVQTYHDRACAVWALGQIGGKPRIIIPILLALIEELKDQPDADQLRCHAAEAIENLTGEMDVLVIVAQHCLQDGYWKSRMDGLFIAERLLKRQSNLRDVFVPLIEPLVNDEVAEIRENARRILDGFGEGE